MDEIVASHLTQLTKACTVLFCRRSDASRWYDVNQHFFDELDTSEKAYWFGFASTDGYITASQRHSTLVLTLQERDRTHLSKFLAAMNSHHPINKSYYGLPTIHIGSNMLVAAMIKHGMVPGQKTLTGPPSELPGSLQSDYWRGVFDADGTITKSPTFSVYLYGHLPKLEPFREYITGEMTMVSLAKILPMTGCYGIHFGGKNVANQAADVLYNNAYVYLDRKHDRYIEWKTQCRAA